jgi:hypothetical protein
MQGLIPHSDSPLSHQFIFIATVLAFLSSLIETNRKGRVKVFGKELARTTLGAFAFLATTFVTIVFLIEGMYS